MFGIIVLLKHSPSFLLHLPGRFNRFLIKNVSVQFSIHPSFNYMKRSSAVCWKQPHTMMFSPSNFTAGMFTALSKCWSVNFKHASTYVFFRNGGNERAYRSRLQRFLSLLQVFNTFSLCHFSLETHHLWTSMVWFLCLCGLDASLPTSSENFIA